MKLEFLQASEADADELITAQNAAFAEDLHQYGECPAIIEDHQLMLQGIKNRIIYKIKVDGKIVGSIDVRRRTSSHYYLRVLSVHPDYQNQGIGTKALQFLFNTYPKAKLWTLITPKDKKRNRHVYEKAGFYRVKEITQSDVLTLVSYRKGDEPMKILVVNGSPRGDKGNTEVLTKAFLQGAKDAGAEYETIYLKDANIHHCRGCFDCWFKTPGTCVFKDDMPGFLEKIREADILVCAVPLYIFTFSGLMKDFLDRMLPMAQPFIEIKNGIATHPSRYNDMNLKSFVLISNCGFPEQENFAGLKETIRCWFRAEQQAIAGMICCAGGSVLQVPDVQDQIKWYIDAVKQAGIEVVEKGHISEETQGILNQPLSKDPEKFVEMLNSFFSSKGIERIDVSSFQEKL